MSWVIYHAADRYRTRSAKYELELAEAVADNDSKTVKKLLALGINPQLNIVGHNREPLIFLTLTKSWFTLPIDKLGDRSRTSYQITAKLECLSLLLHYGADPNARDSLGRSMLEIAILWCLTDTVKLLLLHGADPNLKDSKGQTPLIKAAILGIKDARPIHHKLQIMMHLLDSGARIDAQAPDGKTALMYAIGNSRLEIVKFLVSNGASLTIEDRQGNRARDIISSGSTRQQQQYIRQILDRPQLNVSKYEYPEFVAEGDRQLASIIERQTGDNPTFEDLPRKF